MRTLSYAGATAPFKQGETVIYDGIPMQVTGCYRFMNGVEWRAGIRHARTGVELEVPCYCLAPLRSACAVVDGGLANVVFFPNPSRLERGPYAQNPTGGDVA